MYLLLVTVAVCTPLWARDWYKKKQPDGSVWTYEHAEKMSYNLKDEHHVYPYIGSDTQQVLGRRTRWQETRATGHVKQIGCQLYYSESQNLHYVMCTGMARETVQINGRPVGGILELRREKKPGTLLFEPVRSWDLEYRTGRLVALGEGEPGKNMASNSSAPEQQQPSAQLPSVATEKPPSSTASNECRLLSGFAKTLCEKAAAVGVVGR